MTLIFLVNTACWLLEKICIMYQNRIKWKKKNNKQTIGAVWWCKIPLIKNLFISNSAQMLLFKNKNLAFQCSYIKANCPFLVFDTKFKWNVNFRHYFFILVSREKIRINLCLLCHESTFFCTYKFFHCKVCITEPPNYYNEKKKEKNCGSFLITNAKKNYSDFKFPYYFHQFHHNQKQKSAKHCHLCSGTLGSMIMLDHQRSHNNNSTGMSQAH